VGGSTRESDKIKQLEDLRFALLGRKAILDDEGFGDEVERGPARIQRACGVLENELNLRADLAELLFWKSSDFLLVEEDRAGGGAFEASAT